MVLPQGIAISVMLKFGKNTFNNRMKIYRGAIYYLSKKNLQTFSSIVIHGTELSSWLECQKLFWLEVFDLLGL
ncbi:hypothetical protein EUGRSUZ_A02252 [Eucalyptus grandis]|uniref:Uncharacterized protein n=2 Tax=Eucalyptus grandis TaxID=71139 RepID=A0ACC3M6X8_EUCGR|nr:hypothetical protein EUGRSUZ_A02252 [Eucalyptus grandis]